MENHLTPHSTMRNIILPLLVAGATAGMADAASGVRIHRIGDPPLPPRALDTHSSDYYHKRLAPAARTAKPQPAAPSATTAQGKRLPLAPQGFVPAAKPVPPSAPAAGPVVMNRPVSRYSPAPQQVVAPQPLPQQQPAPAKRAGRLPLAPVGTPAAPAPAPVAAPAPAPVKPVVAPAPQPQAAPAAPAAAPARQRRRLPIAPIVVADGSTDLPPVPAALIRHS